MNSVEIAQRAIKFGIIHKTKQSAPAVRLTPRGADDHQERMNDMASIAVPLHSLKYPGLTTIIDARDLYLVSQYRWNVQRGRNTFYAIAITRVNGKTRTVRMHRLIASRRDDLFIDHIDGDGLNNTRANLREVSNAQNLRNRHDRATRKSMFTGVYFSAGSSRRPWKAYIGVGGGSPTYLGRFATDIEAAHAYDDALDRFGITDRTRNLPREYSKEKGIVENVENVETAPSTFHLPEKPYGINEFIYREKKS